MHMTCTYCESKRPRHTVEKKSTRKGEKAQQRTRLCRDCASLRGLVGR